MLTDRASSSGLVSDEVGSDEGHQWVSTLIEPGCWVVAERRDIPANHKLLIISPLFSWPVRLADGTTANKGRGTRTLPLRSLFACLEVECCLGDKEHQGNHALCSSANCLEK